MKILSLESSTTAASCCVTEDGQILSRSAIHANLTHSRTLMPMVQSTLSNADLTLKEMDYIAIAAGPGSFTGVRIGVAAAKGLAFADNIPCVSVSTLEGIAHLAKGLPFDGFVCPLMDARCQQVYTALFELKDGVLTRLQPDKAVPSQEVKQYLQEQNRPTLLLGDGAEMCYTAWMSELDCLHLAPLSIRYPDAIGVAFAAEEKILLGDTLTPAELLPIYLRLPQAERELKAKQGQ